ACGAREGPRGARRRAARAPQRAAARRHRDRWTRGHARHRRGARRSGVRVARTRTAPALLDPHARSAGAARAVRGGVVRRDRRECRDRPALRASRSTRALRMRRARSLDAAGWLGVALTLAVLGVALGADVVAPGDPFAA